MTDCFNLLRMADAITVNNFLVDYVLPEDGVICLLDLNDQVLAILPEDKDSVIVHMAIRDNSEGFFYDFNLDQEFLGVSRFEPK